MNSFYAVSGLSESGKWVRADLFLGDCRVVCSGLQGITALVTDPPYGIRFMGKAWDDPDILEKTNKRREGTFTEHEGQTGKNGGFASIAAEAGAYDLSPSAMLQFQEWAQDIFSCLKPSLLPGAPVMVFGSPRAHHRVMSGIEDAGFIIRDCLTWLYGSGFPKSLNIGKAVKAQKTTGKSNPKSVRKTAMGDDYQPNPMSGTEDYGHKGNRYTGEKGAPITPDETWAGYGTALKPAVEKILAAVKPANIEVVISQLTRLENELCLLSANAVATQSNSNRILSKEVEGSAPKNVGPSCATQEGSSEAMVMLPSVSVMTSCLNIVRLWKSTLGDLCSLPRTFIIAMESETIIDLTTLNSLLSKTTPDFIIREETKAPGWMSSVWLVGQIFAAASTSIECIRMLSAQGNATSHGAVVSPERVGLVPSSSEIILAMKPLDKNFAKNALKHGVAGLNIDACRIGNTTETHAKSSDAAKGNGIFGEYGEVKTESKDYGRFPSNLLFSHSEDCVLSGIATEVVSVHNAPAGTFAGGEPERGSETVYRKRATELEVYLCAPDCPVGMLNAQGPKSKGTGKNRIQKAGLGGGIKAQYDGRKTAPTCPNAPDMVRNFGDGGGISRFFYCAKPSRRERNAGCCVCKTKCQCGLPKSSHPTVKSIGIMDYLIRLVKMPAKNLILDPFMGSGSTGIACCQEEVDFIGVEMDQNYIEIAKARIRHAFKTKFKVWGEDKKRKKS